MARTRRIDAAVVVLLTAFAMLSLPVLDDVAEEYRTAGPLAYALVAVAAGVTLVRHRWPAAGLLVAGGAVAGYLTIGYPYGPVFGFVVLTVYTAGRRLSPLVSGPLTAVVFASLLVHLATNEAAVPGPLGVLPAAAWVAIPYTVGFARRLVVAAGVRERAAVASRAADAERLRVAQEVHDVVGHGLAAIQVQADIALHVRAQRPEQATAALQAISSASAEALEELRQTLQRIHPDAADSTTTPAPGLARAGDLCDRLANSGLAVRLVVEGEQQPLPADADVAAYRVLQESLTNVLKHSAHPAAEVRIEHQPEQVRVSVVNQHAGDHGEWGLGVTGMQRRTASVGGSCTVGVGTEPGTFSVVAAFPRRDVQVGGAL